jgi:hypothetical protein
MPHEIDLDAASAAADAWTNKSYSRGDTGQISTPGGKAVRAVCGDLNAKSGRSKIGTQQNREA